MFSANFFSGHVKIGFVNPTKQRFDLWQKSKNSCSKPDEYLENYYCLRKINFYLKEPLEHVEINFQSHDENFSPMFQNYFLYSLEKLAKEFFS